MQQQALCTVNGPASSTKASEKIMRSEVFEVQLARFNLCPFSDALGRWRTFIGALFWFAVKVSMQVLGFKTQKGNLFREYLGNGDKYRESISCVS